jgi:predicted metal-binding membrane protein
MQRRAHWPDTWLVWLGAIILIAWVQLALGGSVLSLPAICTAGAVPLSASLDLALISGSPFKFALSWGLMVVAMMLPLAVAPLWHLRVRTFARRRGRSTLAFIAGYIAIWMAAGIVLQTVALLLRWVVSPPIASAGLAIAAALVWQISPAKQWFLNRCHQRPPLAAFGLAADRDAFLFGLKNGAACAGACWALMLPMLLIADGRFVAMIATTLFILAESLESPARLAWRWRGGAKVLRVLVAWRPARVRYFAPLTKSRILRVRRSSAVLIE